MCYQPEHKWMTIFECLMVFTFDYYRYQLSDFENGNRVTIAGNHESSLYLYRGHSYSFVFIFIYFCPTFKWVLSYNHCRLWINPPILSNRVWQEMTRLVPVLLLLFSSLFFRKSPNLFVQLFKVS